MRISVRTSLAAGLVSLAAVSGAVLILQDRTSIADDHLRFLKGKTVRIHDLPPGKAAISIPLRNTASTECRITAIDSSCGCLVAPLSRRVLRPRDTITLQATLSLDAGERRVAHLLVHHCGRVDVVRIEGQARVPGVLVPDRARIVYNAVRGERAEIPVRARLEGPDTDIWAWEVHPRSLLRVRTGTRRRSGSGFVYETTVVLRDARPIDRGLVVLRVGRPVLAQMKIPLRVVCTPSLVSPRAVATAVSASERLPALIATLAANVAAGYELRLVKAPPWLEVRFRGDAIALYLVSPLTQKLQVGRLVFVATGDAAQRQVVVNVALEASP